MKIKRFVARDMRQALRMVRETLGDDAVILSNKSTDEGIELTAAIDLVTEENVVTEQSYTAESKLAQQIEESSRRHLEAKAATESAISSNSRRPAKKSARIGVDSSSHTPSHRDIAAPVPAADQSEALAEMRKEMANLRQWMQAELSGLSWSELGQRSPHVQELIRRFMNMGLAADISRRLGERVSDQKELKQAWKKALYYLSEEIETAQEDVIERGGVIALVGSTGVGKTTTIAKMAARYALRHGNRHVALVTTDNYRIGARDQLQTYGRILNVPVRTANTPQEMDTVLTSLSDRSLVLVDTAGMAVNDEKLEQQFANLEVVGDSLTTLLTLSATTDTNTMERALRLFEGARPDGAIVTKLDEAASLGGVMSTLIHSGLPLTYTTDGQRVPEDIQSARAHSLLVKAVDLMKANNPDMDAEYLAMAYGGAAANAHI